VPNLPRGQGGHRQGTLWLLLALQSYKALSGTAACDEAFERCDLEWGKEEGGVRGAGVAASGDAGMGGGGAVGMKESAEQHKRVNDERCQCAVGRGCREGAKGAAAK